METETRYHRQLLLPEIGPEGQQLLRRARVLLVGVGGLGSPIALYLTGAGVGTLGLVDDDVVSLTNLHRQVLYGESLLGRSKAEEAARRLTALNPEVKIEVHAERLTPDNAERLVSQYDIVVDGCDNFATRYLIDDTCAALHRPYVYGAVCGFEGQASVFHFGPAPRRYRDLYPDEAAVLSMPHPGKAIVGMTPGVVGSVMAQQVVQIVCGYGQPLCGRLWSIDLRTMESLLLDF